MFLKDMWDDFKEMVGFGPKIVLPERIKKEERPPVTKPPVTDNKSRIADAFDKHQKNVEESLASAMREINKRVEEVGKRAEEAAKKANGDLDHLFKITRNQNKGENTGSYTYVKTVVEKSPEVPVPSPVSKGVDKVSISNPVVDPMADPGVQAAIKAAFEQGKKAAEAAISKQQINPNVVSKKIVVFFNGSDDRAKGVPFFIGEFKDTWEEAVDNDLVDKIGSIMDNDTDLFDMRDNEFVAFVEGLDMPDWMLNGEMFNWSKAPSKRFVID